MSAPATFVLPAGPWFAPCPSCGKQIERCDSTPVPVAITAPPFMPIVEYRDVRPLLTMIPCGCKWKGEAKLDGHTLIVTWLNPPPQIERLSA